MSPKPAHSYESANLDFLRSVAVLLVLITHLCDLWFANVGMMWGFSWRLGQLGVLMFFVHTCFVLMCSLERSGLRGWRLFTSFYIRRVFRLYPLSIVCVLLAYCFDLRWAHADLWQNLTLTQYLFYTGTPVFPPLLTPLWSLPLELEMYIVLPLCYLLFRQRPLKLLVGLWTTSVAMAFLQPYLGDCFFVLRFVPCFLGGVMAWRVIRQRQQGNLPGYFWPIAIGVISLIWLTAAPGYAPLAIAGFGLLLGLAIPLFSELEWPYIKSTARTIAKYSFGIYLVHFPIMIFILNDPRHPMFKNIHQLPLLHHYARPVYLTLIVTLTASAAVALYHLVERPGIRLGQAVAQWIVSEPGRKSSTEELSLRISTPA
jgi:peptidoglycan/LPS O-acetylase OafA/YrhL